MNNIEKGKLGETIAKKYLIQIGYRIKILNFRCKIGEVDIICEDKNKKLLIFIEVKLRTNFKFGYPREAVNLQKQDKIKKTALYFIKKYNKYDYNIQFDVIEINYSKKELNHLKNAF